MRTIRDRVLVLLSLLAAACARAPSSPPPSQAPSVQEPATSGGAEGESRPAAPLPALADEATTLGGGILRARLPRGEATTDDGSTIPPGHLAPSLHVIRRSTGELLVTGMDIGARSDDDFPTRVAEAERLWRCAPLEAEIVPEAALDAPPGFTVVAYRPDVACSVDEPPDTRLWVRAADGNVSLVELACREGDCLADRAAWLGAFVGSFEAGTPVSAPAGERIVGPTPFFAVRAEVPEGFLVERSDGEDYVVFELFRRRSMGDPWEGITISFLYSASPNSLEEDYRPSEGRVRRVPGTIGGRRTRLLQIVKEGRTRLVGRISLPEVQLDVEMSAATPLALAELRTIVAEMELPEDTE